MTDPDPPVDRQSFKSLRRRGFAIFTSYNLNKSLIPRNDDYFSKCPSFFYSPRILPLPRARNLSVANSASYISYGPIYSADEWYLSLCNPAKFCGGAER